MRTEHEFLPELPDVDSCAVTNCGLRKANRIHQKPAGSEGAQRYEVEREIDAKHAQVMSGQSAEWDAKVIDQLIRITAATGSEFSANDIRDHLPNVATQIIGARFRILAKRKEIRDTGQRVMSSDPDTRHEIKVWVSTQNREKAS